MTGCNAPITYHNVDVCHNALINNITETLSICDGFMTEQTISHAPDPHNIYDFMIAHYLIHRGFFTH
jgi:hypothetical protein